MLNTLTGRARLDARRRAFLGSFLVGAMALAACSSGGEGGDETTAEATTGQAAADSSTVTVAMTESSEPESGFDPFYGWGAGDGHVHEPLIQSTLVRIASDMTFENDLATDYSVSDDGLLWTFDIRTDATFTDGEAVTADDVAFTVNEFIEAPGAPTDLTMVEGATAVDEDTVEIALSEPFNPLLYALATMGIVPEHAYDSSYGENPVGSGRYMLDSWNKGEQAVLVANPDYYGDAPNMERVVVVFSSEEAALAGAQSGDIDIVYTSAVQADQNINGYHLEAVESVDSRGISLPVDPSGGTVIDSGEEYPAGNDVTADLAIRQAMNLAVDRESMVEHTINGHGTVAFTVADGMPWASDDMKVETDVEAAKEILDEGGWVPRDSDGIREKDGLAAEFDLVYPSSDATRQALAEDFSAQMAEIGINAQPVGLSWDEIYERMYETPILWGWGSNSPIEMYNLLHSEGTANFANYKNDTVDSHLDAAYSRLTIEESFDDYKNAQWDGSEGVAPQGAATWVWFANIDHLYFARDGLNIGDQILHPHGHGWSLVNNVDEWTWEN